MFNPTPEQVLEFVMFGKIELTDEVLEQLCDEVVIDEDDE